MSILDGLFGAGMSGALGGFFGSNPPQNNQEQLFSAQEQRRALAAAQQIQSRPQQSKYDDGDVLDIDCEEAKPKQLKEWNDPHA